MHDFVRKMFTVFLLFLFLEKSALRLIFHTHYHSSTINANVSKKHVSNSNSISIINCDCLDDFFIPLESVDQIVILIPILHLENDIIINNQQNTTVQSLALSSLRGPPSFS